MTIKKLSLLCGSLVFFTFASLQFNDGAQYGNVDAWSWIVLYALTALLSVIIAFKHCPTWLPTSWAGFTAGALWFRLQDDQGNFHFERLNPSSYWAEDGATMIQSANESGGLLIMLLWCLILTWSNARHNSNPYL